MIQLRSLLAWAESHPEAAALVAAAVVSVLRAAYALLARLVAPYPRLRAAVEAVAAIGPDPLRAILQALRAVTGRALPWTVADARDAEIAALRAEVARLQGPSTRAAERGSARPGALLVVVVLALGAYLVVGCGPAREAVMRAAPGVPDPVGCVAGTQRCDGQVPQVCSASGRWWPSLPVRPDGSQRECGACVVEDGVAGCSL